MTPATPFWAFAAASSPQEARQQEKLVLLKAAAGVLGSLARPFRVYFMGSTQAQCRTGRRWVHPPTVVTPESQLAVGSGVGHIQLCNQAQCDEGPSGGPFSLSLTVFQLPRTCISSEYQFTTDSHKRQPVHVFTSEVSVGRLFPQATPDHVFRASGCIR